MKTKICIIVPIGYLDRFGYQYTWQTCLDSMSHFADKVYLVSSVPDPDIGNKLNEFPNVELISDSTTWFARTVDSVWFDAYKVLENVNTGINYAYIDNAYDVAIAMFINNYIPLDNFDALAERCEAMLKTGRLWDWYYRQDQLYDMIFGASVRMPYIYNLREGLRYRFTVDAIVGATTEVHRMERGDFSEFDNEAIVDVQLEMSVKDLADKMNFIRCYSDLVPKRKPVFDEAFWLDDYYPKKFAQKRILRRGKELIDPYSLAIKNVHKPYFVSLHILQELLGGYWI